MKNFIKPTTKKIFKNNINKWADTIATSFHLTLKQHGINQADSFSFVGNFRKYIKNLALNYDLTPKEANRIITTYIDLYDKQNSTLIRKSVKPLLPTIAEKCDNQDKWLQNIITSNNLPNQNGTFSLATDFMQVFCNKLSPLANIEVLSILPYKNVGLYDIYNDQIEAKKATSGLKIISTFHTTCHMGIYFKQSFRRIDLKTSDNRNYKISYDSAVIHLENGHHSIIRKTHTEPYLLFSHPNLPNDNIERLLVNYIKDDATYILIKDGAISCEDIYSSFNTNPFHHTDLILTKTLDIQQYKDPSNVPQYWFSWNNKEFNQHLLKKIKSYIVYTIKSGGKGGEHYAYSSSASRKYEISNLKSLIDGFTHVILKYPENVKALVESISKIKDDAHNLIPEAINLIISSINYKHKDLLFNPDIIRLFMKFDYVSNLGQSIAKYGTSKEIEILVNQLNDEVITYEQADYVSKILNDCRAILPSEIFNPLNKDVQTTRTYEGLFHIIKCDNETFKGCSTLKPDLKEYYTKSPPEVQDVLNIAMKAFIKQDGNYAPYFRYDPELVAKEPALGYFSHGHYDYKMGLRNDMLGGDIHINAYDRIDTYQWSTFVHEMAHKAFYIIYDNAANPYNNDESKKAYKDVMDKITQYTIIEGCEEGLSLNCIKNNFGIPFQFLTSVISRDLITMPFLYKESKYDLEYVVRYYQYLAKLGNDIANDFFEGMQEWHNNNLIPKAVEKNLLPTYRLSEIKEDPLAGEIVTTDKGEL